MISLNDLIWEDEDLTTNIDPGGPPMYELCIIESCVSINPPCGILYSCYPPYSVFSENCD
jgi:hypothetical protein